MNTSSTPSRKKEKDGIDPNSPQSLIKSFLKAKLPDFKMEEKQKIQHQFPALFEESQFLDTSDTFLSETSSVSSSIVLSLPESFEASHSQPLLFSPKTKAKYDIAIQKANASKPFPIEQTTQQQIISQQLEHITALEAQLLQYQSRIAYLEEQSFQEKKLFSQRMQQLQGMFEQEKQCKSSYEDEVRSLTKRLQENDKLQYQMREYEALYTNQKDTMNSLVSTKERLVQENDDLVRQSKLLTLDKSHLQQENERLSSAHQMEKNLAMQYKQDLVAAELKITTLQEKLMENTLTAQQTYDQKLTQAVQQMREEATAQKSAWQDQHSTVQGREDRYFNEVKQALEQEKRVLMEENKSLQESVYRLQQQVLTVSAEKQQEVAQLVNEVKMKAFELASFTVTFEERMAQLRSTQLTQERCEKELAHYKSAMVQLEQEHHKLQVHSEQEITQLRDQLRAYDLLENEIDSAILRTASTLTTQHNRTVRLSNTATSEAKDSNTIANSDLPVLLKLLGMDTIDSTGTMQTGNTTHNNTGSTVSVIPTNPQRRLRQTLTLAQDVLRLEGETHTLRQRLEAQELELRQVREEKTHLSEIVQQVSEPQTSLVRQLKHAKNEWLRSQQAYETLLEKFDRLTTQHGQVKERLVWLLGQREELRQVKVMLAHLYQLEATQEEEEGSSDSDNEEESDEEEEDVGNDNGAVAVPPPVTPPRSPPVPIPLPTSHTDATTSPILAIAPSGDTGKSALDLAHSLAQRLHLPVSTIQQMLTPPVPRHSMNRNVNTTSEEDPVLYHLSHNGPGSYGGIVQLSHTREYHTT